MLHDIFYTTCGHGSTHFGRTFNYFAFFLPTYIPTPYVACHLSYMGEHVQANPEDLCRGMQVLGQISKHLGHI